MRKEIIVTVLAIFYALEDNAVSAEEEDYPGTYEDSTGAGELGLEDEIVLFFMFSFFAFCVSIFGSFLFYVSYLDDRIMTQYAEQGEFVEGEVVATEFTRGADSSVDDIGKNVNFSEKEYFVSVEYMFLLSENYPIRIRKQLRVLGGDFFHPGQNPTDCDLVDPCSFPCVPGNKNIEAKARPRIEIVASRDSFFKSFQFDHGKMLELLVMPNHHLSALPARQVQRRISTRYRLYSISFVIAAYSIAIFCFRLAAPLLQRLLYEGAEEGDSDVSSVITAQGLFHPFQINFVYAMFALAPIPCIHQILHGHIQDALEGEYFDTGGDVIGGGYDDSSLSSTSAFGYSRTSLEAQSTYT
eukprot:CAMPEP_0168192812 /NCGR_PEP_ID=MMETSP0139_2-20121125/18249_1 /TAXON_ID=44445 /ORGANISM="Pseudo-nitzschia australis, Strain 10249 10 AB" /LENGTH=354 /DNA_ID=CAMNT_0008116079 /DNA_START=174 /DNA_END=1238 /DNA_ORIENTATION=-